MIKVENIEVFGFEPAIRGMRNPMNSWDKSDSVFCMGAVSVGDADLALMKKLFNSGTDHRKFMRMITVSMDITAPLYWWKEFDTYKVGTVANSCSTMHKIHSRHLFAEDFSTEDLDETDIAILQTIINQLNYKIDKFNETCSKFHWKAVIKLLPESYNQKRTVMLNYETLANMFFARKEHKLDEWRDFCSNTIASLPYFRDIVGVDDGSLGE